MLATFKCKECGAEHEEIVKEGTETIDCPNCGGHCDKVFKPCKSFQLKGTGWFSPQGKSG